VYGLYSLILARISESLKRWYSCGVSEEFRGAYDENADRELSGPRLSSDLGGNDGARMDL
jgi:hypothetical protein